MTVAKGAVEITSSTYLNDSKRFLLRVGSLIPIETRTEVVSETRSVTTQVETRTSTSSESATSIVKPVPIETGTVLTPSTKPLWTEAPKVVTATKVTSNLPFIRNSFFQTQSSAKKVSRVAVQGESGFLTLSKSIPVQLRVPISKKSAKLSLRVKPEGKPAVILIKDRKVSKGNFDSQLLQFKKAGNYAITILVNNKKSILQLRVKR
jgi:hypothetical protein